MVKILRLDDIAPIHEDDGLQWRPVRHELGLMAHGLTTWTGVNAGDQIIDDHDEADTRHEELYLVLDGHARFVIDGEEHDAPRGTLVFVGPDARRVAYAVDAGTTLFITGGVVGEAFTPTAWELRDIAKHGR